MKANCVIEVLYGLGWRSVGDAQSDNITRAVIGRELLDAVFEDRKQIEIAEREVALLGVMSKGSHVHFGGYSPNCEDCKRDADALTDWDIEFEAWWKRHGQYGRAGGGHYEKTFAFNAWKAAREVKP